MRVLIKQLIWGNWHENERTQSIIMSANLIQTWNEEQTWPREEKTMERPETGITVRELKCYAEKIIYDSMKVVGIRMRTHEEARLTSINKK